jgi:hypothetical protein
LWFVWLFLTVKKKPLARRSIAVRESCNRNQCSELLVLQIATSVSLCCFGMAQTREEQIQSRSGRQHCKTHHFHPCRLLWRGLFKTEQRDSAPKNNPTPLNSTAVQRLQIRDFLGNHNCESGRYWVLCALHSNPTSPQLHTSVFQGQSADCALRLARVKRSQEREVLTPMTVGHLCE